MNDEQLKREIEESLAVEPSSQFIARVRRHLENESFRGSKQVSWTAMVAGLAAAAVVAGIGLFESFILCKLRKSFTSRARTWRFPCLLQRIRTPHLP